MKNTEITFPDTIKGKNILITGGSTGIGRATLVMLASLGANVMFVARHRKELDDAMADVSETGRNNLILPFEADVSKEEDIEKIFSEFDSNFGRLDVLINNAALAYQSVLDGSHAERNYIVDTNVGGYLACSNEAAKRMKENNRGHIINVGSMSADVREKDSSVYVATKAAIQGFSGALRKELNPHGIKVTLIEPGATATNMQGDDAKALEKKVQSKEMLDASDVAAAISYSLMQPDRCNITVVQLKPILQII